MPQPKAFQKYQRGRSQKFITTLNDRVRADLDAAKAAYEDKIGQRVSYPVLLHRVALVMLEHLAKASSITERDVLMDLIARGEVVERSTPRGPELVISMAAFLSEATTHAATA
jgi:hypothetical protein